ncbi:MAG: dihydrodipicolinate synthase family protein, partial [Novipirellula sp. JB048]
MSQPDPLPLAGSRRLLAALPTPCGEPGVVDPAAMARLAVQVARHGCDGVFVLGSTGEMVLIDEVERRKLTSETRRQLDSSTLLYVGIGGFGAKQATRYAALAGRDGADVAVAMAPFFQRLDQTQLVSHFEQIADHSPIPVGIYHHLRMNSPISVQTIARLAEHPNLVAYKDTSTEL